MPELLRPDGAFANVALLTCDVDGVLTDGGLYFDANGVGMVRFHVLDGMGLKLLQSAGVRTCFVTQSSNPAIAARARILGIDHCILGVDDKVAPVKDVAKTLDISLSQVCHIADDVNDLGLLRAVGVSVTVPGGVDAVQDVCRFVTKAAGGQGAVRELCDVIIASRP